MQQDRMELFHTGFQMIRKPDLRHGRKNADFGQGFYLSDSGDFAGKWARERTGERVYVNAYNLDCTGLQVLRLQRNGEWFDYIFHNRRGRDLHPEADVVIGPIANDTLYDTLGIVTSGYLSQCEALELLMIGPEYLQIAVKTEKAAGQLTWQSARQLSHGETAQFREQVQREEQVYQEAFAAALFRMTGEG